jgi:hypothetical protein
LSPETPVNLWRQGNKKRRMQFLHAALKETQVG